MLILLSPAKRLDYDSPIPAAIAASADSTASITTQAQFLPQASALIALLRQHPPQAIASLMHLSDPLAALNVARYHTWTADNAAGTARPALLAFNGDVYEGLQAQRLSRADWDWAQQHLDILSGLYGVLRPLDAMQPYRLEMGTRLATPAGNNLYQFWGTQIAQHLNTQLATQQPPPPNGAAPIVLNLASQEYFKSVDLKTLKARVIECVFEDYKSGQYKIISFYAKRARGLMSRYVIQNRIDDIEGLKGFAAEGYAFAAEDSEPDRLVFRRREA